MASRSLLRELPALARTTPRLASAPSSLSSLSWGATAARSFRSSARMMDTASEAIPTRRPVGAFRGGLFGFLLGSTLAGVGVYYYVLEEYRVSNELLTEDIYSLQAAVQRIHTFVTGLEERLDNQEKKVGKK